MLNGTSAFSPYGGGLYLGQNYGGYSGIGTGGSIFGSGYGGSSRVTSKVASYLRTEYSDTIEKAKRYLAQGDFDKAMDKIESLRDHASEFAVQCGQSADDEQISTILNKAGANFNSYVDENSRDSFMTGVLNGIPIVGLFFDTYSKQEIQAKLGNEDVRLVDNMKESSGKIISGAATGAIAGFAVGGPLTALAGAGIGVAIAFGQNLIKEWVISQ